MFDLPPAPDVPGNQQTSKTWRIRYEDVCQDGRPRFTALPHAAGPLLWRGVMRQHPLGAALRQRGIVPILARVRFAPGDARVLPFQELTGHGRFHLAHTRDDAGAVNRLVMIMWLSLGTQAGQPGQPGSADAGRLVAEHVLTRPLAPPEQRKVLALDVPGVPAVPEARHLWQAPERTLDVPAGAIALEPELRPDHAATVFGIDDTDQNHHVNSMVYPRLFGQAALRRLADLGRTTALLCREVEVAYRKPSFAGQRMRMVLRAFEVEDRPGALGCLVSDADASDPERLAQVLATGRAHCFFRMLFAP